MLFNPFNILARILIKSLVRNMGLPPRKGSFPSTSYWTFNSYIFYCKNIRCWNSYKCIVCSPLRAPFEGDESFT